MCKYKYKSFVLDTYLFLKSNQFKNALQDAETTPNDTQNSN